MEKLKLYLDQNSMNMDTSNMNIEDRLKEILSLNNNINTKILELLTIVHNSQSKNTIQALSVDPSFNIIDAVNSDIWPPAVDQHLIVDLNKEEDLKERANGVIEIYMNENLEGKKFLDFGCGDGRVVEAAKNAQFAIGYDIKNHDYWSNVNCTTDWRKIEDNGPYDVVLAFDVLDHLINENPLDALKKIKSVMKNKSILHVRFHPFTSRSAIHSHRKLNKAYLQLVLNNEQLLSLLPNEGDFIPNNGPSKPIMAYEQWIRDSGFLITSREENKLYPEEFFKNPNIANLIQNKTGFNEFPEFQLSLEFIDYKLLNP